MTYEQMLQQRLRALLETIDPGVTSDLLIAEYKHTRGGDTASGPHCGRKADRSDRYRVTIQHNANTEHQIDGRTLTKR